MSKIKLHSTSELHGLCRIGFEVANHIHWYTTEDFLVKVDIDYWGRSRKQPGKALSIAKECCVYEGKELKH